MKTSPPSSAAAAGPAGFQFRAFVRAPGSIPPESARTPPFVSARHAAHREPARFSLNTFLTSPERLLPEWRPLRRRSSPPAPSLAWLHLLQGHALRVAVATISLMVIVHSTHSSTHG
jgi:hypothetical protein